MSRYQYTPITDKTAEIRLVTLRPRVNPFSKTLHVVITHVKLYSDDVPDYEALSYTWGTIDSPVTIFVDNGGSNRKLEVTKNLAEILVCLRHKTKSRIFWIDSICIDQENLQERSQQVARMADIYRLAPRTTAWLGPSDKDSRIAMDLLSELSTMVDVDWVAQEMVPTELAKRTGNEDWANLNEYTAYSKKQWRSVLSLVSRPWFERLWIVQEICLSAGAAVLVCGEDSLSWLSFRNAIFCLYIKRYLLSAFDKPADWVEIRAALYELCCSGDYTTWKRLLTTVRKAKCSDPKDKVYGILSLIHPNDALVIEPDYTKTHYEVYTDLVLQYMKQKQRLDLLQCCHLAERDPLLPSWVPNLAVNTTSRTEYLPRLEANGLSRCESGMIDEKTLKVAGRRVGTVKGGQISTFGGRTYEETLKAVRRLAPRNLDDDYITGGSVANAYGRVICSQIGSRELYWPPDPKYLDEATSNVAIRKFLDMTKTIAETVDSLLPRERLYIEQICNTLHNLQFLTTEEGYLGIGPPSAQPGDQIFAVPGLNALLLIREHPSQPGKFELVGGENFFHGLMQNEGLLGPLPWPYRAVLCITEDQAIFSSFINQETGVYHTDDPRLRDVPRPWAIKPHRLDKYYNLFLDEVNGEEMTFDPRLTIEEIKKLDEVKKLGFEFEDILLI